MNKPRHNVCDHCGRNPHKVAIRVRAAKMNAMNATKVIGLCPSCFASSLDPKPWNPTPWANRDAKVLYDRRGERSKAQAPVPDHLAAR